MFKNVIPGPARRVMALVLALFLSMSGAAWGNGNTTADAPDPAAPRQSEPVKRSVRKAPVRTPAKPRAKKKAAAKKPAASRKKAASATRTPAWGSSLDRGIALMQQERYEAALPWLRRAIQENRRSAAAWYWYGMYHEKTGKFYEAQYFYTKAVNVDPTFEPLSRVVVYPGDGEKTPLWDPKRPARVYSVPTDSRGVATIPPDAPQAGKRPTRPPIDPELPKVPVYMPPEPGASPMDGDAWRPSVYVPPTMGEATAEIMGEGGPVYVPPSGAMMGQAPQPMPQTAAEPVLLGAPASSTPLQPASSTPLQQAAPSTGGAPVYQPPLPPQQQLRQAARPTSPSKPAVEAKPAGQEKKSTKKKSAPRKVVKAKEAGAEAPAPKGSASKKPVPTKRGPAVQEPPRPQEPVIVPQAEEPRPPAPRPASHDVQPEPPARRRMEELPPVGQTSPEDSAPSLPPVGQGEP